MNTDRTQRIPAAIRPRFDEVFNLIHMVCGEHLNNEYAQLALEATAALARKRPSPIIQGQAKSWACGIVYALGRVNFLFDQKQDLHLSRPELCAAFGVSTNTGDSKARAVRTALKIRQFDPDWTLPSMLASNPLVWMVQIDGLLYDARFLPQDLQENHVSAGVIPFVPVRQA